MHMAQGGGGVGGGGGAPGGCGRGQQGVLTASKQFRGREDTMLVIKGIRILVYFKRVCLLAQEQINTTAACVLHGSLVISQSARAIFA